MSALRRPLVLAALLVASGCSDTPTVDVSTYVGPSHARKDPERQAAQTREVLAALLPAPEAAAPEVEAPTITVHAPRDAEQLEGLVAAMRTGSIADLGGPARRIAAAGPEVWPGVRALLAAERPAPKGDYRSLLRAIGGDVPNRYGHFALHWKKAHGHKVKLSEDWFQDLLALPRSKVSSGLRDVYRDTILHAALLRAAVGAAADPALAPDVVSTLLDAAFRDDGLFRDEVARAIESIGDPAIPHLVAAAVVPRHARRHDLEAWVMRPQFAEAMLDRMDRLHPSRAIEAVGSDPQLLSQVLAAYGVALRSEAATEILARVDAPTPKVRSAARVAWLSYVAGPAPGISSRTIKLLGGGTGHAQAFLSYRERARLALLGQLAASAPDLLEPPCDERRENGSIDAHCQSQPLRLTLAYFQRLDDARSAARARALEAALGAEDPDEGVRRIDRLLAQENAITQPDRVAAFLERVGREALAAGRPARAAQLLRKAAVLSAPRDATLAERLHVQALLAEASVEGLGADGRAMLLRTAAELDPDDDQIQQALAAVRRERAIRPSSGPNLAWGIGLVALALSCLSMIGGGVRRAVCG